MLGADSLAASNSAFTNFSGVAHPLRGEVRARDVVERAPELVRARLRELRLPRSRRPVKQNPLPLRPQAVLVLLWELLRHLERLQDDSNRLVHSDEVRELHLERGSLHARRSSGRDRVVHLRAAAAAVALGGCRFRWLSVVRLVRLGRRRSCSCCFCCSESVLDGLGARPKLHDALLKGLPRGFVRAARVHRVQLMASLAVALQRLHEFVVGLMLGAALEQVFCGGHERRIRRRGPRRLRWWRWRWRWRGGDNARGSVHRVCTRCALPGVFLVCDEEKKPRRARRVHACTRPPVQVRRQLPALCHRVAVSPCRRVGEGGGGVGRRLLS